MSESGCVKQDFQSDWSVEGASGSAEGHGGDASLSIRGKKCLFIKFNFIL